MKPSTTKPAIKEAFLGRLLAAPPDQRVREPSHKETRWIRGQRVRRLLPVSVLLLAMTTGACSLVTAPDAPESATVNTDLRGVCPATVVVQTNWWPQAEYGAVYHLLGEPLKVHMAKKRVNAPLVVAGRDTGIRLEIRAGGPAIGFQQVSRLLYADRSITLGGVATDEQVQNAATQPTLAVFAPMDLNPQVLMWDSQLFPQFTTIADIGQTDTTVLYLQGATYMEFLVGSGVLRRSQVVGKYDARPTRFLAAGGKIVQQGYLTNEPYAYHHELRQWGRPLTYELLHDAGYPIYPETLAVRFEDKARLAPCLTRLVPILQQATADYAAKPDETNKLISELVDQMSGYPYSTDRAAWAVGKMLSEGILGNGAHTPDTVGDFDPARVEKSISVVGPILAGQNKPVPARLAAGDLVTDEFIATGVGLGAAPKPRR